VSEFEALISERDDLYARITSLLMPVAEDQDWAPDSEKWSFRYVAAHLAAVQCKCILPRIRQFAAGESPGLEFYWNTDRDFHGEDLVESVGAWAAYRGEALEFVQGLPPDRAALTGSHKTFGRITALDYLKIDLEHDRGHLEDLERLLSAKSGSGGGHEVMSLKS
jgi:DinB superfamily